MTGQSDRTKTAQPHCSLDELLDFLTEAESSGDGHVESHLADCARCADLLGQVSRTSLLVDNWTVKRAAELSSTLAVSMGLEYALRRPENQAWAKALIRWIEEFSGRVQAVVGVHVSSRSKGALSFPSTEKAFLVPGGWEVVPAVMARGEVIRIASIRGIPEARIELRTTAAESKGRPTAVVTLPASLGIKSGERLAVLIPQNQPQLANVQPLQRQVDGSWAAEFIGLDTGTYLIVLEPGSFLDN